MQSVDSRKNFILTTIGNHFQQNGLEDIISTFSNSKELNNFLDNGSCMVLCSKLQLPSNTILLSNEVLLDDSKNRLLVFFKIRSTVITPDNLYSDILISSMLNSPISNLYHAIQKIYAPLLLTGKTGNEKLDSKLEDLLLQLQNGLGSVLQKQDKGFLSYCTISDELNYWKTLISSSSSKEKQQAAAAFSDVLQTLIYTFETAHGVSISALDDLVQTAGNVLDDLWKLRDGSLAYPHDRMLNLFHVVGYTLLNFLQTKLSAIDLWIVSFSYFESTLLDAVNVSSQWIEICQRLTVIFWPQYMSNPWKQKPYFPEMFKVFSDRLQQMISLRRHHYYLCQLLSNSEVKELGLENSFSCFFGLNSVLCNPYTEALWRAAVAQFESNVNVAEQRTTGKLKIILQNNVENPLQLLDQFKRYGQLIKKTYTNKALSPERAVLLGRLFEYINLKRKEFTGSERGPTNRHASMNISELVYKITSARQLEVNVKEVSTLAMDLLTDLPECSTLITLADEFLSELVNYQNDQFESWLQDVGSSIENKTLSLPENDPVMKFYPDSTMQVAFNPRYDGLIREMRQLSFLGFNIPQTVKKMCDSAKKFSKQAKQLQQIANFHNTVGDQMLASQRPLMLEAAVRLENLVKQQKNIRWSDTKALEEYIKKLQELTEKLSKENRILRSHHKFICEKVSLLMTTDLLRHQQLWKDGLVEIRHLVSKVEQQGYSKDSMSSWKAHWDRQLYKALEHQFQAGLLVLHNNLPEIKVELTYRHKRLQFNPPLEEIKTKYYIQMKKFLCIPTVFKGIHEIVQQQLIFSVIIERNANLFGPIYIRAESIFDRLETLHNNYKKWFFVNNMNINELVEQHLKAPEDWDRNFRSIKLKAQEVAALPNEEKINCVVVNLTPVKIAIDDQIQSMWDTFKISLQTSISDDVRRLQEFLSDSFTALSHRPQTVEEIGQAKFKRDELISQMKEMIQLKATAESKNKVLGLWVKDKVRSLGEVRTNWNTFERKLDIYEQTISKQVEDLKCQVEQSVLNFHTEVDKFKINWHQCKPKQDAMEDEQFLETNLILIKEKLEEFESLLLKESKLLFDGQQFGLEMVEIPSLKDLKEDVFRTKDIWFLYEEFNSGLKKFAGEQWTSFYVKTYSFGDYLSTWLEKLDSNVLKDTTFCVHMVNQIEKYKACLPLLMYCRGDNFLPEHWAEMLAIIGISRTVKVETLTFGDLLSVSSNIVLNINMLKELSVRAQGEILLRQSMRELDTWAVTTSFTFYDYVDSEGKSLKLIKEWKDVLNKIGDYRNMLQSLHDSLYYQSFSDQASVWEKRLGELDEYLHQLQTVQRKWLYLEPIFGRGALAKEGSRFTQINRDFKSLMGDILITGRITSVYSISGIKYTLSSLLDQLQRCQKSLNEYLEKKRLIFPRFYFIGDDDLLELLGQPTNSAVIEAHLKKLFFGVHTVELDSDGRHIQAVKSLEGEVVRLENKIRITDEIEEWLKDLSHELVNTLQNMLLNCVKEVGSGCDPNKYPQQILCLAEYIWFTEQCSSAISSSSLKSCFNHYKSKLQSLTSVNVESDLECGVLNLKLKAIILDTIYFVSVLEQLIASGTKSIEDWSWQKQLRYYLVGKKVLVRMVDAEFEYTYEYQGNAPKLVHTPLTDKCYLTLTQAMKMGLGGNPYGPAGTGKTESVKALGNLLGRQVIVFNCDEGIDLKSMAKIFVGIIKSGSWGCFDEFNRLEEVVLSSVSTYIQAIQEALKNKLKTVKLLGNQDINPNSGIFVTLNPLCKGYGGRQKLPDNLKQLFCSVVMSIPDSELIAEVLLYSEGFKYAKIIGHKLITIFNLTKELLSPQQHYDWGLRAFKTVLRICGKFLATENRIVGNCTDEEKNNRLTVESQLAVKALKMNTNSKLTYHDRICFNSIIDDIFVDVPVAADDTSCNDLREAIRTACDSMGLSFIECQVNKVLELYEQLQQRTGLVIIGPSGTGKSALWKILLEALKTLKQQVKHYVINPKSMSRSQLLGYIDGETREWTDGVLTSTARKIVKETLDVNSWVVFDGDVDPEWIESLNSVLDDNRLLTMPSGERIAFAPNTNFIFETHDLSSASPATISRMGVIYLCENDVDLIAVVNYWLKQQNRSLEPFLRQLVDDYFFTAVNWIKQQKDFLVETSVVGVVINCLSFLISCKTKKEFVLRLIKCLGANLSEASRELFVEQVSSWINDVRVPQSVFDCYYNADKDEYELYNHGGNFSFDLKNNSLVLTSNMLNWQDFILELLRSKDRPAFIIVGPEACGKSVLLQHCAQQLRSCQVVVINCSTTTNQQDILYKLDQLCVVLSSASGRTYRPRESETLILFFKGLNLVKPDKWGTCYLVSFLQQIITYGGFYDDKLEWVNLEAIQIIGSLVPGKSMGRHLLSTRFTSVVRIVSTSSLSEQYLQTICYSHLTLSVGKLVKHPIWSSVSKVHHLANSMVQLFMQVCKVFAVDDHHQYVFTPRHLVNWSTGLVRYNLDAAVGEGGTSQALLTIWSYEAQRVFGDLLINAEAKSKLNRVIQSVLSQEWGIDYDPLSATYYSSLSSTESARKLVNISSEQMKLVIKKEIDRYSQQNHPLELVMFPEVLRHICQIDRVLSARGGSAVLCGPSGYGRSTLLKLVCFAQGKNVVSLKMCRGYGISHFKNDLKNVMQMTGIDGQEIVLLVEDHHLTDDVFVEMLNSLISTGEIMRLFTPMELEPLVAPLKDAAAQEEFRGNLFNYFAERIRHYLHVIFVLDILNVRLPTYLETNVALRCECSVIYLDCWSKESMTIFPKAVLSSNIDLDDGYGKLFYDIHNSCCPNLITPRKYYNFVKMYEKIYINKKRLLEERRKRLQIGVMKLNESKTVVNNLKSEAAEQASLLAEKRADADKALDLITNSMQNAGDQKIEMEVLRDETMKENEKLTVRRKAIEAELSEIEPLIKEAKAAVGNIKTESLSEIRSLRAPPDVIRDILEAVLNLMGHYDTSWNNMKNFLAKRGVKEEICSFDVRNITIQSRESVEQLLKTRKDSFVSKNAKRASAAAAPLAAWVQANVRYAQVLYKIKPLEDEQTKLMKNLAKAESRMDKLSSDLDNVDRYVGELRERLNKSTKEATELEIKLQKAVKNIESAEILVSKLDEEFERWSNQVTELADQIASLPPQSLIAAAFITYLSSATEDVRRKSMNQWFNIINIEGVDIQNILSSEKEHLQWKKEGLPLDELYMENALIIVQDAPKPLLIDPSGIATEWLKRHFQNVKFEAVNQEDPHFKTALEGAIQFGKILLVQEVTSIDSFLFPIFKDEVFNMGPRKLIQIGDKAIDYHSEFRLILATKNVNIEIPSQTMSFITVINFSTTRAGLHGQLLATAIQHEQPNLEEKRSSLLLQEEDLQAQLIQLEDYLLEQLAASKGDILENTELLSSLNKAKENCKTIEESLNEFKRVQQSIAHERDAYLPLAEFGGKLYFTMCDLVKINNMYCIGLNTFLKLFQEALTYRQESNNLAGRISKITSRFRILVYSYVVRSLFKVDHLTFALHLVHSMYPELFEKNEWEAFAGTLIADFKNDIEEAKKYLPTWVNDERALSYSLLKNIFPKLYHELQLENESLWKTFSESSECERNIPSTVLQRLSKFQKVLIVQALRPERLYSAMTQFCLEILGINNLSPAPINLKLLSEESTATEPILIMTSQASDPSQELRETALKVVGEDRFHQIAMGEGKIELFFQLLRKCANNGDWLCVNNVHLVSRWLTQLESELAALKVNPNFRLWLTCEPHFRFNSSFLQRCLKITFEAPPGIKRNLQRTFNMWPPEFISKGGSIIRAQTLYVLAWFQATVVERLNFVPQGWTKCYEFSYSDLKAGADILDRICEKTAKSNPNWEFIHGLFENSVYGGKIDNSFDVRLVASYLRQYFNSDVITGATTSGKRLSFNLTMPISYQHSEYVKCINQLPEEEKPTDLGLPANVENSAQRTRSAHVISQLRVLGRASEVTDKFERDKLHSELSPILNLWKKLNQSSKMVRTRVEEPDASGEPVSTIIQLEYFNAVNLVQFIHSTLATVSKVLRGTVLLTGEVAHTAKSLLRQETPLVWLEKWNLGPSEPLHYLRSVMSKALSIEQLVNDLKSGTLLSRPVNLASMFHPERFLNAFKQQTARETKVSIDDLEMVTTWKDGGNGGRKHALVITGLYIEGCVFAGHILSENAHDSPSLAAVPNATIQWVHKKDLRKVENVVSLPLYQSKDRQQLITCLDVPCAGDTVKWIQCSAALFLHNDL